MDLLVFCECACAILTLLFVMRTILSSGKRRQGNRLPPGPPGRPILGHLHLLQLPLHESLHKLAQQYGPIVFIKMGAMPTVVISSPDLARKFLHEHDHDFADRPSMEASKRIFLDNGSMVMMEYGPLWRELRKLYTVHMLSVRRVGMFERSRLEEMHTCLETLQNHALRGKPNVDMRKLVFNTVGNMMSRMLFSKRLFDLDEAFSGEESHFKAIVERSAVVFGTPFLGDLIPWLSWLDIQGLRRMMDASRKEYDDFFEAIITERIMEREGHAAADDDDEKDKDCLDTLLNASFCILAYNCPDVAAKVLSHAHSCSYSCIHFHSSSSLTYLPGCLLKNFQHGVSISSCSQYLFCAWMSAHSRHKCIHNELHALQDLMSASVETTTTSIEWTIAELLRNPRHLNKLREELDMVSSSDPHHNCLEDPQLGNLKYLEAIVKESLRLHPPFSVDMRQMCGGLKNGLKVGEYYFPAKTRLLTNLWAMARDTNVWGSSAGQFCPERFLVDEDSRDVRGQHYELLPFGTGRRGCPGTNMALTVVPFVVANLVKAFDWEIPDGAVLDLSEGAALTAPMAKPLIAVPCIRRSSSSSS
ncbi:hypothetical protein KP509_06G083200 [Ceratopteris richardii]|uniref:Cytochrome P450 n=1 Tax=Ceratopteris richardii TaxID=49495 RepID=A0A8T2UMY8_CERRI|nr:hypothetical protein KP509_06G083200 [Ceratopteris richardii]